MAACLLWSAGAGASCAPTSSGHEARPARTPGPEAPRPVESSAAPAAPADLLAPPADAQASPTGLVTRVLEPGTGHRTPRAQDRVRVHFTGWKSSGKVINSTHGGEPATFALGDVIPGWAEGLRLMRVGERRRLWIPDHLSYLRPGRPPSDVVFDIELVQILESDTPPAPADVAAAPADAIRTPSGLAYKILQVRDGGDRPRPWDRVTLRYSAWSADGELFDAASSATFDLGDVIPGWAEALPLLAAGERARLWVPEHLADRRRRRGPVAFDVELSSIERRPAPPSPPADLARARRRATRTPSGLAFRIVKRGTGARHPGIGSRVQVHYSGWTREGSLFDTSLIRGRPRTVPLARVIAGWREALQRMVEGDKALLWVPESLAYAGAPGAPPGPLVYELELLQILQ